MTRSHGFYQQMHQVLRDRLLDAAADLICAGGWNAVTMTAVAARVGVSRQAAYRQIPGIAALAEAVITRETDRILAGVTTHLRRCDDPVTAITAAAGHVLDFATASPLIKALLTEGRAGAPDLLPLITTRPEAVLSRAIAVVTTEAQARYTALGLDLGLDDQTIARGSEIIVRLTLSHLIQPTGPTSEALAQIRLTAQAILASHPT